MSAAERLPKPQLVEQVYMTRGMFSSKLATQYKRSDVLPPHDDLKY